MDERIVTTKDAVRLHVVRAGNPNGQPIVFVHGWSQSHLCWRKQLESSLAERFCLIAFDLRGHGDSDKPVEGYGLSATWADDMQAVIERLSLRRPLLVGWSYGGLVINDYVRRHGQSDLAGLCYVGAATDLGMEVGYDFLGSSWNGLLPGTTGDVAGTVFSANDEEVSRAMRVFVRGCFAKLLPAGEEALFLGFNLQCPSRVRAALFNRAIGNDDLLARLRLPVLVVHGASDEVIRIGTGRHIASLVPGALMSEYEGVGHAPFWEDADRFNAELASFAESCCS